MNYGRRRTIVAARTALERAVSVSKEKKNEEAKVSIQEERQEAPVLGRGLCPKCRVKPNHYFHVKNCKA